MKMRLMILIFASVVWGNAAELPKILTVGVRDAACLDAAYKVLYVEARVGIPHDHKVIIACDADHFDTMLHEHGLTRQNSPWGFTDPKTTTTYLDAASIRRADGDSWVHDGHRVSVSNFGEFLIAHEIGHLATSHPEEWIADTWANQALNKYVKTSYEDFKLVASNKGAN